jgi:phage shock protein A
MTWYHRFTLVIQSNISALIERFEDPERMLNQLLADMEVDLDRVRASTAAVIADEIQLGKRATQARQEIGVWDDRAATAFRRGEERMARTLLEQKLLAEQRVEALAAQHQKQQAETSRLETAVRDLEEKIRQANERRSLLLARLARAESARSIDRVLHRAQSTSAFAHFDRMEKRVERAEAMEEAYLRLEGRDPAVEELSRELAEKERQERLQWEFDELRRKVSASIDAPPGQKPA